MSKVIINWEGEDYEVKDYRFPEVGDLILDRYEVIVYTHGVYYTRRCYNVNNFEKNHILKKCQKSLEVGDKYWTITQSFHVDNIRWSGNIIDEDLLKRGLVFETKEKAEQAAAKALEAIQKL